MVEASDVLDYMGCLGRVAESYQNVIDEGCDPEHSSNICALESAISDFYLIVPCEFRTQRDVKEVVERATKLLRWFNRQYLSNPSTNHS